MPIGIRHRGQRHLELKAALVLRNIKLTARSFLLKLRSGSARDVMTHPSSTIPRPRERWYVMTLVYALNIADRFPVTTPIRKELTLSDTGIARHTGGKVSCSGAAGRGRAPARRVG